jgi:hypothetical protein
MRDRVVSLSLLVAASLVVSSPAWAQPGGGLGATPLAVDLKKAAMGSWAEYKIAFGDQAAKARWALVGRKSDSVTIEMIMEGGPAAQMGGKMTARLVMAPDPTKVDHAVKQMVMQLEGQDPMEMPTQGTNQKFEKPDPKKLVGKETITVPGGSFPTSHYRDSNERGNIDMWISETAPPLGLVKLQFTPKPGAAMPPVTMELSGKGKDAKATITKTPKPFDPAAMMGMRGGARPGGPPPPGGGPPPGSAAPAPGGAAPGTAAPKAPGGAPPKAPATAPAHP